LVSSGVNVLLFPRPLLSLIYFWENAGRAKNIQAALVKAAIDKGKKETCADLPD